MKKKNFNISNIKYDNFLSTDNVHLIVLNEKLAKHSDWYKWLNRQENTKFTKQGLFPNTQLDQVKYFKKNIAKKSIIKKNKQTDKRIQLGIVCRSTNEFIGVISLFRLDFIERSCSLSMLVNRSFKGKNSLKIIKDAQSLMIDHAFNRLNIRRIYVQTYSKQLSELAQKFWGFTLEGVLREKEYLNGKYHDSYALGLLKREWIKFNS